MTLKTPGSFESVETTTKALAGTVGMQRNEEGMSDTLNTENSSWGSSFLASR